MANICGKHYRGNHVVQGELEFPCQITVWIPGNVVCYWLVSRYERLLKYLYIEHKDEKIMGTFFSMTNETLREAKPCQPSKKKE